MPTRILREGILTSEKVNSLSPQAELFYRRLMSVADDYGRYFSHPGLLRAACYPLQLDKVCEADVKQMLSECTACAIVYQYGGKYLQIANFGQQTRSKSKFPEPAETELLSKCTANANHLCSESESESESNAKTKTGLASPVSLGKKITEADKVILSKEYDRINVRLQSLRESYGDHQDWTDKDKAERQRLLSRRKELRATLGITI